MKIWILLGFIFQASVGMAQTYQLTVQNGYGSGQYSAGDTVYIWSKEWPMTETFSHWTGQTSFLQMPDEWHTSLIMPSQNVTVTSNIRGLPPGADFTEEYLMGRDTIQQVFYYFPAGGPPKGVVWLFHGGGGAAEYWIDLLLEQRLFANFLMADTFAVIVMECEERTKNRDLDGDGSFRWQYIPDSIANVDIANVRAVRDTFIHRGWMTAQTPQIAEGFSNGGFFSPLLGTLLRWKSGLMHNAYGFSELFKLSSLPVLFSMSLFDNHPDIGASGNLEAYNNYQDLLNKGNCTQFYLQRPTPIYPQRFMRVPGINAIKSMGLYNELKNNGCVNSKDFLISSPNEIMAMAITNPQNWSVLLSLTLKQFHYVTEEVGVMMALHYFHTDFNAKDLQFIRQACDMPLATSSPKNKEILNLFPNPVRQTLTLPENCDEVRIHTLEGQLVMTKIMNGETQLDVATFANGFYIVEIKMNGHTQVAQFIKM